MEEGNSEKRKKNHGGSRKFNQIGTNGICFSVSPAPSSPKQVRKLGWRGEEARQSLPCKAGPTMGSLESVVITIQYFRSLIVSLRKTADASNLGALQSPAIVFAGVLCVVGFFFVCFFKGDITEVPL